MKEAVSRAAVSIVEVAKGEERTMEGLTAEEPRVEEPKEVVPIGEVSRTRVLKEPF